MRAIARVEAFTALLGVFTIVSVVTGSDYGIPIEIKLWDSGRTPLSHMVDVTNEFGLKVLAEHSFLNDNNIAFSPYGLMGILVALYEGVDGESSYQIQRGLQLPWNRNVMRIGFRDIHRTLKTYFVPEEGFLAGLALNNENVTFNDSYKKILRFYGFDLESDQLPTLPSRNGTNETSTMSSESTTAASISTAAGREELPTTNPNAETITEVNTRLPTTSPSAPAPSFAPNAESPTTFNFIPTTETTTEVVSSTQNTMETTEIISENVKFTTTTFSMPTVVVPEDSTDLNISVSTTSTFSSNIEEVTMSSTSEQQETSVTNSDETTSSGPTDIPNDENIERTTRARTPSGDIATTINTEPTVESLERRKKSIVDFIFMNPSYTDDYLYRSFDIPVAQATNSSGENSNIFLANGLKSIPVSYMHYDTVLEHAFLPHLEAAALRLPLDSDRYYLLVVSPTRAGPADLHRLLGRLARRSDLRDVYAALRPRRVKALVPSFTVKGHVTLTADLQKVGIRDVFEPRQRDFTPMTPQSGVFVRSIEQAVSVAIRKYDNNEQHTSRYVANQKPVHFSATYPFLYFVMDASIHVALMAGQMADPLNSRIL